MMSKRPGLPRLRRSAPLLLAVFLVGAGIGAALIALSHHQPKPRLIVKRVIRNRPATTSTSKTTQSTTAATAHPTVHHTNPKYAPTVPADAAASFQTLAASLDGSVGLAVAPLGDGPLQSFGQAQSAHAWSTSKVPVLTTLLHEDETRNLVLSAQGKTDATLALTQSDNAAIEALFSDLEQIDGGLGPASEAVQQILREAGDETTIINTAPNDQAFTTYGQSIWPVKGEVTFYRALAKGCLIDAHDTAYVLGLMHDVIPSQRWGAGSAGYPPGTSLAFKGGWGPDSNGKYQVRQTAIIGTGNQGYVMSMLALPASGSFSDGTSMITALATWARQHFAVNAKRPSAVCDTQQ